VSAATILGELPALPLHEAGKYVAAAYIVLFALVLIYVAIMALRIGRFQRELGELSQLAQRPREQDGDARGETELGVGRAGVGRAQPSTAPDADDVGRPRSAPLGAPSSGGAA
jgi:hypothetical protein